MSSNPDSAIKLIHSSLQPGTPEFNYLMALVYHSKGLVDSSALYINSAWRDLNPNRQDFLKRKSELLYLKGWVHYKRKEIDSAELNNQKVLQYCQSNHFDSLEVFVLKNLGNIFLMKGKYSAAFEKYEQALEIERGRNKPSVTTLASLIQNKAIIFASTGQLDSARQYFAQSLELKESIGNTEDVSLANGYINFSNYLRSIGDPVEALKYINKAEQLLLSNYGKDYQGLAPVYQNKGSILIVLNNYEDALIYHELAINAYNKYLNPEDKVFVSLNYNIGNIHEALGNYSRAIQYHLDVIDKELDPEQRVKTLRSLGSCYANINNNDLAEHYYRLAVNSAEKNLGVKDNQTALCYLRMGYYYNTINAHDRAIAYYNRSLEVFREIYGSHNRDVSNVLTYIGLYYNLLGEYKLSLQYYQKSLNAFFESYSDTNFYHNPELSANDLDFNIFNTLYGKSFSFYGLYQRMTHDLRDLKACMQTIDIAIKYYDNFKTTLDADNSKLLLATRVNNIYNLAVETAAELYFETGEPHYIDLAFSYSEKSKSQVLLASVRESDAIQGGMIPPNLRENEQTIKKQITLLNNAIFEEKQQNVPDSVKLSKWQQDLYNQKILYDSLISNLEVNYPVYYNLKYNFDVIPVGKVKQRMEQNQVLIEYKLTDTLLFAFVISQDTTVLLRTRVDTTFPGKVEHFITIMNTLPLNTDPHESSIEYAMLGKELYDKLFRGNFYNGKHLIIIPDDILGYLSFDALVTETPEEQDINFRNMNYLIKNHTIYYGYSATLLLNEEKRSFYQNNLLAMAPQYNNNQYGIASSDPNLRNLGEYLNPLYHTEEEVSRINKTFKGKVLMGDQATEHNFKVNAPKYDILHFAMHTLINDENPFATKLVFSSVDDTIDDGFLNIYEIYNLNLNAELAVLSACKTGVGKLNRGEGIMSLARGFLYAGVPGIVMTLWAIEDVSSMEIVTGFYQNLKEGLKKDQALRKAKLDYLNNADQLRSHPYFWAAYVQIGDNSKLSSDNSWKFIGLIGLVGLLLLGVIIFVYRRRKKLKY